MNIKINPKYVLRTLLIVIGILALANIGVNFIRFNFVLDGGEWSDNKYALRLINLFDMDTEGNVPSYYSSLALLFSSILLYFITLYNKKSGSKIFPWALLSSVFLYLALDEILELHEHLVRITESFLNLSGYGTSYWIIPFGIMGVILFIVLFKFLKELPKKTLRQFIVAGFVFILGAVGVEILGGIHEEINGRQNVTYVSLYTVEETLEMVGIALFIYALTTYKKFTINLVEHSESYHSVYTGETDPIPVTTNK